MSSSANCSVCHDLRAFSVALFLTCLALAGSGPFLDWLMVNPISHVTSRVIEQRGVGLILANAAFAREDVLPLYGSSELIWNVNNRPAEFFSESPTGFQVCPIGKPGATSLLIAQKIAAMGRIMRHKKVAIILSPIWFNEKSVLPDHYRGNFSPLHACKILLNRSLPESLRRRFASRMRDFPASLYDQPALGAYMDAMTSENPSSRLKCKQLGLLLKVDEQILSWEDKLGTAFTLWDHHDKLIFELPQAPIPWDTLIQHAATVLPEQDDAPPPLADPSNPSNNRFTRQVDASREWEDLELMLDTLVALEAIPLIISIPQPGSWLERHNVTRASRDHLYKRLESLCEQRGIAVETFSSHDMDEGFTVGRNSHLSEKGWLHVNRLLDAFYHGQRPPSENQGH